MCLETYHMIVVSERSKYYASSKQKKTKKTTKAIAETEERTVQQIIKTWKD